MAGKLEVLFELNIEGVAAQGAKAGKMFGSSFVNSAGQSLNEFLAKMPEKFRVAALKGLGISGSGNIIKPPTEAPGLRGILKSLAMGPLIPPNVIQGLRDVTGKDLAKVFSAGPLIPPGVIKGLRDQTGRDLAKVLSLPDMTSYEKQPLNWKQGILGGLLGLRHPYIGARMMNEAGFFGGGGNGGKGGAMGGLFGGGSMGFEKAFIALAGVELAAKGVKEAFETLKKSFEDGFKLFTESSRLGIKSGELFNREFAARAIGVSVADIEKYMLRQQWGKARTSLQNFGAGSSIRNMQEMFQDMLQSGERLVPVMTRVSGEFYRVGFAGIKLEREFDALIALIGEQLTGVTLDFIQNLQELFQVLNDAGVASTGAHLLSEALALLEKPFALVTGIIGEAAIAFGAFKLVIEDIINLILKIPGAQKLTGIKPFDTATDRTNQAGDIEAMNKHWKRFFTTWPGGKIDPITQGGTPSTGGFKMPREGAWERMGYVIGTRRTDSPEVGVLKEIRDILKNGNKTKPKSGWPRMGIDQSQIGGNYSPA